MKESEALDILCAQGYGVGTPDMVTGRVTIWIRGTEDVVDVAIGRELQELLDGRLSFADILARREDERIETGE